MCTPTPKNETWYAVVPLPLTWKQKWGRGFVTVGKLNYRTAAYTARYTMKKADGKTDAQYEARPTPRIYRDEPPPWYWLQLPPGAWSRFVPGHRAPPKDSIILPAIDEHKQNVNKPPLLILITYAAIDPVAVAKVKARRAEVAEKIQEIKLEETDLCEKDYMEVLEVCRVFRQNFVKKIYGYLLTSCL